MFKKVKVERVYQKVIEQIGEMIKNGYLKRGTSFLLNENS